MRLIFGRHEQLEKRAIKLIEHKIQELLRKQDYVVIGIPGGRTIKGIFQKLLEARIPWKRTQIFMTDERKVPIFDSESNFKQARKIFLFKLMQDGKIRKENIHAYNFQEPAKSYSSELKKYGGRFDILLLSAGEDGHVASLFPNHESIGSTKPLYIDVKKAPKSPEDRISASYSLLVKSKMSITLFLGEEKKQAYEKFINQDLKITQCPVKLINKITESYVLTDLQQ